MRYVRLGRSGLDVSRLGLDCHSFGVARRERGWDPFSYDGEIFAMRTVHAALDAGINLFDTSPEDGGVRAESLLGKALHGRQSSALLASRLCRAADGDALGERIFASLRRLRADHLDIVYLGDQLARQQRSLEMLFRLRERGVVRNIGVSISNAAKARPLIDSGAFDVAEFRCNPAEQGIVSETLNACIAQDMGISVNKPLKSKTLHTLIGTLDADWAGSDRVRQCCLKYLLGDRRIHVISLGMRWEHEVVTNSRIVTKLAPASIHPPVAGPASTTRSTA